MSTIVSNDRHGMSVTEPGETVFQTSKFVNRVHDSDEEQLGLARLGTLDTFWSRHLPRVEAPIRPRSPTGSIPVRVRYPDIGGSTDTV
jgi:hypothetical protein